MAAGDTKPRTKAIGIGYPMVVTLTGLTAATSYDVEVTHPSGRVSVWPIVTDGAGAFVMPEVPTHEQGTYTMVVKSRPATVYTTTWKT